MPVQHSPPRRPATRSQTTALLLLGVEKNPVAPTTPRSTKRPKRTRSLSTTRHVPENRSPPPEVEQLPPPEQPLPRPDIMNGQAKGQAGDRGNNQVNDQNAQGNGAQDVPALRNWEAFCQALYGQRPSLPEFHGRAHKDPAKYLRQCEEYIIAYQIPETHRTKVIEKGLRNDAEKWW